MSLPDPEVCSSRIEHISRCPTCTQVKTFLFSCLQYIRLCALQQTVHGNLSSERLHTAAAVGGAIISISAGALALTLPDITVQCPTLFSCQEKKPLSVYSSRARFASASLQLPSTSSQRKTMRRRRKRWFLMKVLHPNTCKMHQPVKSYIEHKTDTSLLFTLDPVGRLVSHGL